MPVDSIGVPKYARTGSTKSSTNTMPEDRTSLSDADFYKLLAAQMKYQDADNPMSTSEMMAQMVQSRMTEAINNMGAVTTTSYASSMIGKEVTVAEVDKNGQFAGKISGVVTGVLLGSNPAIFIGDKAYSLAQIMVVGKEPPPKEDTKPEEKPDTKPEEKPDEKPDEKIQV